jgi:hypothetical protein
MTTVSSTSSEVWDDRNPADFEEIELSLGSHAGGADRATPAVVFPFRLVRTVGCDGLGEESGDGLGDGSGGGLEFEVISSVQGSLVFIRIAGTEKLGLEGSAWNDFPEKFDRYFCQFRSPHFKIFENASKM